MRGTVNVHTLLKMSLEDRQYDISGSDIALTDVIPQGGGATAPSAQWWARFHLAQAVIAPKAPIYLHTRIERTLSDSRPLFALVAPLYHFQSWKKYASLSTRLASVPGVFLRSYASCSILRANLKVAVYSRSFWTI
jgi:hypothetical protein